MFVLYEYCDLVAETDISIAKKWTSRFKLLLSEFMDCVNNTEINRELFLYFSFTIWVIVNGVWSNLRNVQLRRDLLDISKKRLIIKIVEELAPPDADFSDNAHLAVTIDMDHLMPFFTLYREN